MKEGGTIVVLVVIDESKVGKVCYHPTSSHVSQQADGPTTLTPLTSPRALMMIAKLGTRSNKVIMRRLLQLLLLLLPYALTGLCTVFANMSPIRSVAVVGGTHGNEYTYVRTTSFW